jgi:hypothetical protein
MNILHYINGLRKGKSAHRIEKEAMQDPFLSDALEGFESVSGDHAETIARLQKNIRRKTEKKNLTPIWWAAACAVLVLGFAVYMLMPEQNDVIITQDIPKQDVPHEQQIAKPSDELTKGFEDTDKQKLADEKSTQPAPILPPEVTSESETLELNADERIQTKEEQYEESAKSMAGDYYRTSPQPNEKVAETAIPKPPAAVIAAERSSESTKKSIARKNSEQMVIKGQVLDEHGEALVGAGVKIKGTTIGTATDLDGYFSLKVDSVLNNYLDVAYIGFKPQEVKIDPNKDMAIVLREDAATLDEVVVIGYGTAKRQNMTGAISSVYADDVSPSSSKPQPVIGYKAYKEYLKSSATQPTDKECADAKGKVRLSFYVNERGRPYNVIVEESLCSSCDKKAIDLIYKGSNWTPGTQQVKINIEFSGK